MKTLLITGASGQLGTAVTHFFLDRGYKVIGAVHRLQDSNASHPQLVTEVVDLTDERVAGAFVKKVIAEHGPVDAGLLLAGGFAMGDIQHTSLTDVKAQIRLNFDTAY